MSDVSTRYTSIVCDSSRWDDFEFRDGDIIISTPPKCGTTWMQTICALLIFQTTDLPKAVDLLSPWLDQTLRPLDEVLADLDAQTHRRFIKSHLPFDGLPNDDRVTYICVGRDPRDVALSWDNHVNNLNLEAFIAARARSVGNDDLPEWMAKITVAAESEYERFWQWVDDETPIHETVAGLRFLVHHIDTFWRDRQRPNVIMLHYGDLKADLEGQMRRLAELLGIEVPDERWPELVEAATFEEMKRRAPKAAPNATEPLWQDVNRFFHRGTSGQWVELLSPDDLRRYESRVMLLCEPSLSTWLHQGPAGV